MSDRRSQGQKVGRLKYIIRYLNRIDGRLSNVEHHLRVLREGLGEFLKFDRPYAERILQPTDLDDAIIQILLEAPEGKLPSVIAEDLKARGFREVDRWQVSARIRHMNRILKKELAQPGFEKKGYRWVLTSFFSEIWGVGAATELEVESPPRSHGGPEAEEPEEESAWSY